LLREADAAKHGLRPPWLEWDSGSNAAPGAGNTHFDSLVSVGSNLARLAAFRVVREPILFEELLFCRRENKRRAALETR